MNEKTKQLLQNIAFAYWLVAFVFTFVDMWFEWLTLAEFRALFILLWVILTLFVILIRHDIQ